jgi:ribosome maturation factor RimP
MLDSQKKEQIKETLDSFLEKSGFCLVEINNSYQGNAICLRVIADRPEGGITIDECARLNRQIQEILDKEIVLQQEYILEVSSPGLDRPLVTEKDFSRCLKQGARLFFTELINGKREIEGIINKVENGLVYIDTGGVLFEAPLSKIAKAKRIIN